MREARLTQVRTGFSGRVLVVTLMALFAFLSISASYWNWHGFPPAFEIAEAIDQVAGRTPDVDCPGHGGVPRNACSDVRCPGSLTQ